MGATDSKLAFRKSVFRLYEDKNISVTDNEFWDLFWNLPESADDIFSLIGANDIRRTRDTARENFEILIDKVLEKMQAILKAKQFPTEQNSINQLLNCCRVMTRIMPFVFESTECMEWEESFFWTPRQVEKETKTSDNKPEYEILPCRGEFLLTLTIQSLFLAGFTIPISLATKESKVVYAIWENGVGSTIPISTYKDNESNRTEVLRLLAVLLSKSMYVPPSQLLSKEDLWLRFVAVNTERKVVLVILCSLMNTICNYDPTGWVPYNHVVNGGPREQLVSFCLTNLLILLDYRSPRQADLMRQHDHAIAASPTHDLVTDVQVLTVESTEAIPKTSVELEVFTPQPGEEHHKHEENAFRYYMSRLHRKQDFEFLMNGIHRLLINPMTSVNTYLPGSTKRVGCYIDVMMMCWRLIETNTVKEGFKVLKESYANFTGQRFIKYLVETDRVLDLTVALVFHAIENKDKLSQIGLVRMCAFMLQTLSSNMEFSVKLNKPFVAHSSLPATIRLYAFNGTYADFLIISIFNLIATTQGRLSTLYPALILTMANISPYLANLGVTTVSKLMTLFHSMSLPTFLTADEYNFQLTAYLLETFNSIIHHRFAENPNLIYSIVLHHDYFEKLDHLTFQDAMIQVEKVKLLRESKMEVNTNVAENTASNMDETENNTDPDAEANVAMNIEKQTDAVKDSNTKTGALEDTSIKTDAVVDVTEDHVENKTDTAEAEADNKTDTVEVNAENKTDEAEGSQLTDAADGRQVTDAAEGSQPTDAAEGSQPTDAADESQAADAADESQATDSTVIDSASAEGVPVQQQDQVALSGHHGFNPTEPWMAFWKEKLPLKTILALINTLVPQVEEKCKDSNVTLEELMLFLKTVQVDHVLQEEHPIFIRRFQWGEALVIWFRSMMWGQNYVSSMKEYGAWNGTNVKLFQIKEE